MDVTEFLIDNDVLLIHFAGAEGAEPEHKCYPRNLQSAVRDKFDLCCSTINPNDTHFPWGHIGLIVKPIGIASIKGIAPHDFGSSRLADLSIEVPPEYQTVNRETLLASIKERADMNEWVVSGYEVVGIFIADLVAGNPQIWGAVTAKLSNDFPNLPVYTTFLDRFVKYTEVISTQTAPVREIYSADNLRESVSPILLNLDIDRQGK